MKYKNNKKCIVCGEVYTYCDNCAEFINQPAWKNIYHDANCKEIFNVVSDYLAGILPCAEAKIRLAKCDISNSEHFHPSIAKAIEEINKPAENVKPASTPARGKRTKVKVYDESKHEE